MKSTHVLAGVLSAMTLVGAATAQTTTATMTERNAKQQDRIEQGVATGQLTTKEAAKLERQEASVNAMQSKALQDGTLTRGERARIDAAQNRASNTIAQEKHDGQVADPNSPSSQRMQAAVAQKSTQQHRVAAGVKNGNLTNKEVSNLEQGQAKENQKLARAGSDGHVSATESAQVHHKAKHQSAKIHAKKHNAQTRANAS